MVYRGRLGKGCAECRAKKTRCDAAKPSCGQCKRAGRICSGYRNLDALRLVDQTTDVKSKHSTSKTNKSTSIDVSQPEIAIEVATDPVSAPELIEWDPSIGSPSASSTASSQEDLLEVISGVRSFTAPAFWATYGGQSVFFDQFVRILGQYPKTELDFVATLYGNSPSDGMLSSIVSSLGLAALPQQSKSPSLVLLSEERYCHALRQTQKALQDPVRAKSDETLATVLLLGLHQEIVSESYGDRGRISVHLDGSIRLLQLRGHEGMDHISGTRMFHRTCSQITFSCLHNRRKLPKSLVPFQRTMAKHFNPEELKGAELLEIIERLCDLLASSTVLEPAAVLSNFRTLRAIDSDAQQWLNSLSWRYHCERTAVPRHRANFLHEQDVYTNHLAASVTNRYRCVRICANEEILRLAEIAPERLLEAGENVLDAVSEATTVIMEMSSGIAYSLPYFLGPDTVRLEEEVESSEAAPTMYGAAMTLMPIYFAANPKRVSREMYGWLMQLLRRVGEKTGVARAKLLLNERIMLEAVG